jgi:hypothetical protein
MQMIYAYLVTDLIVGVLAYREAGSFASKNGRTPWGMPQWAWALVAGALGLVFGSILLLIARRTTKPGVTPEAVVASQ